MVGHQEKRIRGVLSVDELEIHLRDAFEEDFLLLDVIAEGKDVFQTLNAFPQDLLVINLQSQYFDHTRECSFAEEVGDVR